MTTTLTSVPQSANTLSQLHSGHNLHETLSALETQVRKSPTQVGLRWALVEFLCVLGQWERALKQLQAAVQLVSTTDPQGAHWQFKAQLVRGLIRAQAQRTEVFSGQQQPVPVIDSPQWMQDLARAIGHNAQGQHAQADELRRSALDNAPTRPGVCTLGSKAAEPATSADEILTEQPYTWLSDTDTRLGPVCELVVAGGYRWLAYADIASLRIQRPSTMLDLVWLPVTLQLRGTQAAGKTLHAYIPTRYSGTENIPADSGEAQRHALLLAHLTLWHDVGDTGVFAQGQKTLMTEHGDIPLLDIRQLQSGEGA